MDTLLEIKNITKMYGSHCALDSFNFTLKKGEIIGLLGVNGAGKTTLSSIIATVHPPTSGDILFNGISIFNDIYSYRMNIGYCPQKNNLNPLLTNKENLYFAGAYFGMSNQEISQRIDYLDELLEIKRFLHNKPNTLSGGWKQRFVIARTLIHSPSIIILDEPTVALDPDIRHQLWQYLKRVPETGTSVYLTTHYIEEAQELSDRVCILNKGKTIRISTVHELLSQYNTNSLESVFIALTREQKEF